MTASLLGVSLFSCSTCFLMFHFFFRIFNLQGFCFQTLAFLNAPQQSSFASFIKYINRSVVCIPSPHFLGSLILPSIFQFTAASLFFFHPESIAFSFQCSLFLDILLCGSMVLLAFLLITYCTLFFSWL
jgi:hypothetical protein